MYFLYTTAYLLIGVAGIANYVFKVRDQYDTVNKYDIPPIIIVGLLWPFVVPFSTLLQFSIFVGKKLKR